MDAERWSPIGSKSLLDRAKGRLELGAGWEANWYSGSVDVILDYELKMMLDNDI